MTMRKAGHVLLLLAAALLVVGLLAGFAPARGTAVEYVRPNRDVNCGTFWVANEWSGDAGCDRVLTERFRWIAGPVILAIPLGLAGGFLVLLARDRQRWSNKH